MELELELERAREEIRSLRQQIEAKDSQLKEKESQVKEKVKEKAKDSQAKEKEKDAQVKGKAEESLSLPVGHHNVKISSVAGIGTCICIVDWKVAVRRSSSFPFFFLASFFPSLHCHFLPLPFPFSFSLSLFPLAHRSIWGSAPNSQSEWSTC